MSDPPTPTQTAAGPTTEAGRRLLAKLDDVSRLSQDTSFPLADDDILAIEQEAVAAFARDLDVASVRRAFDELAYQQDDGEWVAKRTAHDIAAITARFLDRLDALLDAGSAGGAMSRFEAFLLGAAFGATVMAFMWGAHVVGWWS